MNLFARWRAKRRLEQELADEMAEHLAEKIDQLRAEGRSEEEAQILALRQFGNVTLQQESSRAEWGFQAIEQFGQDLQFGIRLLKKNPVFTLTAVLVLAVGIGMNTAMFSAIKAVLLTALPYPEPDRMVSIMQTDKTGHLLHASMPDFRDWRAQTRTIEAMSVYDFGTATMTGDFRPRNVHYAAVGTGFFDVLALRARLGRTFSAAEQRPGGTPSVVLSYELASALFGTPAAALEKSVHLSGLAFTVIGIIPPTCDFPEGTQLWLPNGLFPDESSRSAHNYLVLGRLKAKVDIRQAQADMDVVAARLAASYADDKERGIRVTPLYDSLTGGIRPQLYILWGAVTLVLLIACVNISNLQLARAATRRKELGMRVALGAARSRLLRQIFTENLLLSAGGGTGGLLLAAIAIRILRVSAPIAIPQLQHLSIEPAVLAFTAGLCLLAGFLFGMLPALDSSRADVNDLVKQGTGKGSDQAHKRWGRMLVAGQIALAMILLTSAALLMKSYHKLTTIDTGLDTRNVFLTNITWPASPDGNSVDGTFVKRVATQILAQVRQFPGVESAAFVKGLSFGSAPDGGFEIEGRPLPADPHLGPDADYRLITPEYFKLLRVPVVRGRPFSSADARTSTQVAIVNQSFVKEFFAGGDALGERIRFFGFDRKPQFLTIVGIVSDVRPSFKQPPRSEVYAEYFQHADTRMDADLVIRGPETLEPKIDQMVSSLNRFTAINFERMDHVISSTVERERFETVLLAIFAATALLLATVGLYGLLSYLVTRRTSDLGLRMALGASQARILQLVLSEAGLLVMLGVSFGLFGALLAGRVLQSLLYQMTATDPATLFLAVASFVVVALAAAYVPARRASRIDPLQALRTE